MLEKCVLCGAEITRVETVFYSVEGWEPDRGATGGTNHVKMRKRTGKAAHKVCLERLERGTLHQETLI